MENKALSKEQVESLILDNRGWAESIARAVARAWNMDWQMDGLDGAAMEALIFCAQRFQPDRGVPFRGYARRRIHEAATEAARRSKGWRRSLSKGSKFDERARAVSAELLNIFPELRSGELPFHEEASGDDDFDTRQAIRQLVIGASLIATRQGLEAAQPDEIVDYKRMIAAASHLDAIHQMLLWKAYWEGSSLRNVAVEWETDGLNVIREHKVILIFLQKTISKGKPLAPPKVRPGLRQVAQKLKSKGKLGGPFSNLVKGEHAHG